MSKVVSDWYDDYTVRQLKMGINARNRRIQSWLEKFELKKTDKVLEIGCGIGTQTQLLADFLDSSEQITALDISPKSIEIAKIRNKNYPGINWVTADFVTLEMEEKFDVILMPDVIEHIPVALHEQLFSKVQKALKKEGFVLIHIPQPYYQDWCIKNRPEVLQIIDQPIYTDVLAKNVYVNNLFIWHLQTYSIWKNNGDYQVIVLKHVRDDLNYFPKEISTNISKRIARKVKQLFNK